MDEVKLYDRARKPASWMGIIRRDQFAVFHQDLRSTAELSPRGEAVTDPAESVCCIFDDLDQARSYCEQKVKEYAFMRCAVYDSEGKTHPPLLSVVNAKMRQHVEDSAFAGRRRIRLGYLLLVASLPLFWWDWHSHGLLILPSIIGINLIFVGMRMLMWGYGTVQGQRSHRQE